MNIQNQDCVDMIQSNFNEIIKKSRPYFAAITKSPRPPKRSAVGPKIYMAIAFSPKLSMESTSDFLYLFKKKVCQKPESL